MRVIVLGGTWFIGRAVAGALAAAGHAVLVAHRGIAEPADLAGAAHLHAERAAWPGRKAEFAAFGADAAVDVSAAARRGPGPRVPAARTG
jgi:nucleoside-diphosphate-sugar epimerase